MADLVNQIFKQSQLAAGIGTGLGEFFSAGVRSRQADRQLNLSEQRNQLMTEQVRLDNIRTGLAIEKQKGLEAVRLAEEQAELQLAQNLAKIKSSGAGWSAQNPDVVSSWNLLSKVHPDSPVASMFLDGMTQAEQIRQGEQMLKNLTDQGFSVLSRTVKTPDGSVQLERQFTDAETKEAIRVAREQGLTNIKKDEFGRVTASSPTDGQELIIQQGDDGQFKIIQREGMPPTTANLTKLQESANAAVDIVNLGSELVRLSNPLTVGPGGFLSRAGARLGIKKAGEETDLSSDQVRFVSNMVKALKSDGNIAEAERNALVSAFDVDFFDSPSRFRRAVGRTSRLLIESQKRNLERAGVPVPPELETQNLPWNLLRPEEFLERARIKDPNTPGYLPFNNAKEVREAFDSLVFDANQPFPMR